jgi:CheY-like chemotaxis protein
VPQPLVLAIEPDLRQAAIVKRIVREKVLADVAVVDSRDAALEAMRTTIPDVLLLSALMSPRDEDELIAHLRTLENADHLQTHTIPQLASALNPVESRGPRGLLSAFRRKKEPQEAPSGCDPDLFAEEIRVFLQRAADKKRERSNAAPGAAPADTAWRTAHAQKVATPPTGVDATPESEALSSSWSSPFEWKPSTSSTPMIDPDALVEEPPPAAADLGWPLQASEPAASTAPLQETAPVLPVAPILDPAPIQEAAPVQAAAPILEAAPIRGAGSRSEERGAKTEGSKIEGSKIEGSKIEGSKVEDRGLRIEDRGLRIPDAGFTIRDQRSGIRDRKLGSLAGWARSEERGRETAHASDDLRALLTGLAVPSAVVSVGYGRGCRIRRVRVPAAREAQEAEAVGAVIISRRLLAEQRGQREQSPA